MPHLPYSSRDDDEFLHPTEGWLLTLRTIVFDSWILWSHALPPDRPGRAMLDAETATLITALAEQLHAVHLQMPGYASLDDTPFVFTRWWNPRSEDKAFRDGSSCVFRIKEQSIKALVEAVNVAAPGNLTLTPLYPDMVGRWESSPCDLLRAELKSTDPAFLAQSAPPCARLLKKNQRRTRRNPRP
jgi:hypothetical protein